MRGLPWTVLAPGLREKACVSEEHRFRLLEFLEPFQELDWCVRAHAGYMLEGQIVINVNGKLVTYRQGDVIDLPHGVRHRHDSTVETATLFLVESVNESE